MEWLRREQWYELVKIVIELSDCIDKKLISNEEYHEHERISGKLKNKINLVDFYDT